MGFEKFPLVSAGFEKFARVSVRVEICMGTCGFEVSGSVRVWLGKMVTDSSSGYKINE